MEKTGECQIIIAMFSSMIRLYYVYLAVNFNQVFHFLVVKLRNLFYQFGSETFSMERAHGRQV